MVIEGKRNNHNKMYKKLYYLWYNMNRRCYDPNNPDYKYYGAKGVTVSDEWKTFDNFAEQIDKAKGFDKEKFLNGEIVLDKDTSDMNNLVYSLEKCEFVSKTISNQRKPSQQKKFVAYYKGEYKGIFYNQSEAARILGTTQSLISANLREKTNSKNWHFEYV